MVYDSGANQVGKYLDGTPVEMSFWGNDTVMAYSDYCKMRKQLGYEKIDLKKGHFIVQGVSGVKTVLDKEQPKFQIEGETLSYQACYTEGFALEGDLGAYLILVLPDEYAEKLDIYEAVYAADTEKKSAPEDYENLCRIIEPLEDGEEMDGEDYIPVGNVNVKGAVLGENRTMFTIISFSMFYIALIFCCTALTVLAVQQLSESEKHGKRYRILSELGMPQEGVEKLYEAGRSIFSNAVGASDSTKYLLYTIPQSALSSVHRTGNADKHDQCITWTIFPCVYFISGCNLCRVPQ